MSPTVSTDTTVTELRQDIALHRAELAASVEALADKLDVRPRLKAKARAVAPIALPAAGGLVVLLVLVKRRRR